MLYTFVGTRDGVPRQCVTHSIKVEEGGVSQEREMLVVEMSVHRNYLFVGNHLLDCYDVKELVSILNHWMDNRKLFEEKNENLSQGTS